MHVSSAEPDLGQRLLGWSQVLPDSAVLTHLTAAEARGWWLPQPVPHPVFAAVAERERHPQRAGLRVVRLAAPPATDVVDGLRLATPAETLLSCAADLHVLDLVPLGDSALRLGHCTLDELWAATRARRRGTPMLRTVLPLLDGRSESAWESVLRVLHVTADVEVEPQREIVTASGAFVARADLWLVGTRRIHEYDGADHRDPETHRADLARERRLVDERWERCGYTAREVLRRGGDIIAAADAALGRPWVPARLESWRGLVARSLYGSLGRRRALARWTPTNR
ncbi:hypothetical protein SAMN05421756_103222 [Microlunatus flavus]|uniref:DUF559 domain-containing protein n=1 Tax=Microlunatus flavus TaxID=1036181 RepID=A0A1H9FD64_9ACTN|nr:hypothetical protein SAMN05421756_103222 [Microlunatus flavus]